MKFIIIEADAYSMLLSHVGELTKAVRELKKKVLPENPEWMDAQEVCQALKISKRSLQYLRQMGKIQYTMFGNKAYFKQSDIIQLLDSHTQKNLK